MSVSAGDDALKLRPLLSSQHRARLPCSLTGSVLLVGSRSPNVGLSTSFECKDALSLNLLPE